MLVAVYGTLRKGDYNYDRCMRGYEPLGTQELNGFDMYNLGGSYPYITPGEGAIQVEVYDLPEEIAGPIERMERGAGYEMAEVTTKFGTAQVFYMTDEAHQRQQNPEWGSKPPKILSGDWFQWLKTYRPDRLAA